MDGPQGSAALPDAGTPTRGARSALRAIWAVLWRTLALLVAWGSLLGPLFAVLGPRLGEDASSRPGSARLGVEAGSAVALLVATIVLVRWLDRQPLASVGLGRRRFGRDAALGLAGAVAWLGACLLPLAAAGWVSIDVGGTFSWMTLALAGAALAANAFTQELLFRGYPFRLVARRAGPAAAVLITSLLFSAAHRPALDRAWLPAVNVALAGVLFGVALLRTGNLWLPTALHAGWNVLLGPVLGLDVSGRTDLGTGWHVLALHGPGLATGDAFGLEASLATTIVTSAAIAVLAAALRVTGGGRLPRTPGGR